MDDIELEESAEAFWESVVAAQEPVDGTRKRPCDERTTDDAKARKMDDAKTGKKADELEPNTML